MGCATTSLGGLCGWHPNVIAWLTLLRHRQSLQSRCSQKWYNTLSISWDQRGNASLQTIPFQSNSAFTFK